MTNEQKRCRSAIAVELICSRIADQPGKHLASSDIEALTGLTTRALNYAFKGRFGCTPQGWQRNYCLNLAHELLTKKQTTASVKAIAHQFGFASPASFTKYYKRRFGHTPGVIVSKDSTADSPP